MNQNYEKYDENFQMIQKLEERKIKQIFSDNLSLSTPAFLNTQRKQTDIQYIHKERAILDVRLTNVIQLDLCQFHYIEVPLTGHKKPLVIYFQFTDQAKMKFYISSHTITPNRFNNEESFERKQILRYTEQGEHILFTQRCLYLAIFSQQATTIYAKASFGIKPQQQQKMETESKLRPSTGYQFTRSSQFFFTRKPSKDMISLNKNIEQYQPDKMKLQQNLRRVQSARKLSETLHKKRQIFEEKKETLRERFEFQEKKKILKEIILYRNNIDNFLKFQQKLWLQNLYFIQLVSIIKRRYYDNIIFQFKQSIKKRRQYRVRQVLQRMLQKSGKDIYQRTIFQGLLILRMLSKVKEKGAKKKAKRMVYTFMMSYGQIGEIFQKTYQFKRRMRKIIEVYRNYRKKVQAYANRIIMLWNKYWNQIYMEIKKEDQEKVKQIKVQMQKTIINYHIEEEIVKSPYLDIKVQSVIVNNYYKEIKNLYIRKWRVLKIKVKSSKFQTLMATQAFDKKNELLLFTIVDKSVLKQLIYKYMQEKGMIQSLLLKKN
ncbi:unnamed protein product [Paramecium octaurelia]|uniref:Uncharacterized protein n=1 Tax=Paramecium octaurelia TaxID=43137 RepID=A0A8S1VJU5_PAROT|nr:unnamed protein product [Paramecium octaurelia]